MKSVSLTKLSDLEKDGWRISPSDKNAISTQLAVSKAVAAIALSLESIKQSIDRVEIPQKDDSEIQLLLNNHYELIRDLLSQIVPQKVLTWEFELKRNRNGFLDKVIANGK